MKTSRTLFHVLLTAILAMAFAHSWAASPVNTSELRVGAFATVGDYSAFTSADADAVNALQALGSGVLVKTTSAGTHGLTVRTLTAGTGLTITNGDGVGGNPTIATTGGLLDIAGLSRSDGNVIVGNGTAWVAESGATARGSLGLAGIEDILGMAQDAGAIIVGTGSGWDEQSGDTARTSLGLGSASAVSFASVSTTGAVAATGLLSGSNLPNKGNTNLVAGPSAGPSGSTGVYNVILGTSANSAGGSSGGYSVMIGFHAGRNYGADANAQQAVFIGRHAAYNATTGIASVCVGESAGYGMTTGMDNVLVGSDAGWNAADVAGAGITTGSHNSAFGNNAGYTAADASQTGSNNSAFGANSGWTGGSASYQTAIGAGAMADADNQVMLGRAADEVAIPGDLDLRGEVTSDLTMGAGAQVLADAGTAANPSWSFSGDDDTGMYRLGTNSLGWSTAGVARMALDASRLVLYNQDIGSSTLDTHRPTNIYARSTGGYYVGGTLLLGPNGFRPPSLADASAPNNCVYYSTTASKLVYKDSGGTVNNLY